MIVTPAVARIIVGFVLTVIIAISVSMFATHYRELVKAAAQGQVDKAKLETTSSILADAEESESRAAAVDINITDSRATYRDQLEKARQDDPTVADRDTRPVPDSLRNIARERRLNRERSGRPEEFTETSGETDTAAER